jgi:hypothetical protein
MRRSNTTKAPGARENVNHHLWNNHGTWFVHYTFYPTPVTKQRIRKSLKTRSLCEARRRRDELLGGQAIRTATDTATTSLALAA